MGSGVRHEGLTLQTRGPRWIYKLSEIPLHLNILINSNQHTNQLLETHSLSSKSTNNNTRYIYSFDAYLFASQHNPTQKKSINMVGKNVLAAAAVYFALTSALALPKDKLDDKKSKHDNDDHPKTGLPHKPDDKDCSTKAPYPTGDSTNTDFGTGIGIPTGYFPTGSGFVTGVTLTTEDVATPTATDDSASPTITDDSSLPVITDGSALTTTDDDSPTATDDSAGATETIIAKRAAHPDKGKDDPTSGSSSSRTRSEDNPSRTSDDSSQPTATTSGVEDNTSRTSDVNSRPTASPSGDDNGSGTVTITITETPTVTTTIFISVSTTGTSSSRTKGQKGKKSKTSSSSSTSTSSSSSASSTSTTSSTSSTSSVDDSLSAAPTA